MGFDPPNPSFRRRPESTTLTIHLQFAEEKSLMPACAGMTLKLTRVTSQAIWYYISERVNDALVSLQKKKWFTLSCRP